MKALEKDDQNVYAVIGLTNTIAEHGLVSESQKLYKLVQDMNPQIPHTFVNLAHLHSSEGNSSSAITLIKNVLMNFTQNQEIEKSNFGFAEFITLRMILKSPKRGF